MMYQGNPLPDTPLYTSTPDNSTTEYEEEIPEQNLSSSPTIMQTFFDNITMSLREGDLDSTSQIVNDASIVITNGLNQALAMDDAAAADMWKSMSTILLGKVSTLDAFTIPRTIAAVPSGVPISRVLACDPDISGVYPDTYYRDKPNQKFESCVVTVDPMTGEGVFRHSGAPNVSNKLTCRRTEITSGNNTGTYSNGTITWSDGSVWSK
jgi:hypothetical protein